jgi:hypothetical protein
MRRLILSSLIVCLSMQAQIVGRHRKLFTPTGGGGTVAYRSSSTVNYASHANTTITAPAGIANGDLLLIYFCVGAASVITATPPTGFTALTGFPSSVTDSGFNVNCYAWKKTASSESGSYVVTHATNSSLAYMGAYSGANASTPINPNPTIATGAGTTSTATGLTTAANNSYVVAFYQDWGDVSNQLVKPTGTTPTFTTRANQADTTLLFVCDGPLATAGATGNKAITNNNSGSHPWQAALIAIAP